jgi:hypothetical protein
MHSNPFFRAGAKLILSHERAIAHYIAGKNRSKAQGVAGQGVPHTPPNDEVVHSN